MKPFALTLAVMMMLSLAMAEEPAKPAEAPPAPEAPIVKAEAPTARPAPEVKAETKATPKTKTETVEVQAVKESTPIVKPPAYTPPKSETAPVTRDSTGALGTSPRQVGSMTIYRAPDGSAKSTTTTTTGGVTTSRDASGRTTGTSYSAPRTAPLKK